MYILRRTTALLILLIAAATAMADTVAYVGETTTLSVTAENGDTYLWEIYDDGSVNFATTSGLTPGIDFDFVGGNTGSAVQVHWKKKGIYFFKVTATNITGCASNIKIGIIEVKEALPTAVLSNPVPNPVCLGDVVTMEVTLTGVGPWEITYTDGTNSWTIPNITETVYQWTIKPTVPAWYWITEVKDTNGTNNKPSKMFWIEVKPRPDISPIYQYSP